MSIKIENLAKEYKGGFKAVADLNLTINTGVLGLLGPNGAGKSSLMRMIATVSKPTAGNILWNDIDIVKNPKEIRKVLGYLPQYFGLYDNLNVFEFLSYIAAIKGLDSEISKTRIKELVDALNLSAVSKRPLGKYSGGMRQRVGIAQALLNDPHVLIVDEPTVGLDPEERARFRDLIKEFAKDRIIIFSTHIVSDIESIANTVAIMNKGKLITHEPLKSLLEQGQGSLETAYMNIVQETNKP